MKISDILSIIESNYPKDLAYEWDNPGLILGDENRNIKKALVSLDVTQEAVSYTHLSYTIINAYAV